MNTTRASNTVLRAQCALAHSWPKQQEVYGLIEYETIGNLQRDDPEQAKYSYIFTFSLRTMMLQVNGTTRTTEKNGL